MSYTKLHSEIIHSTIWLEPSNVRVLWITMLALRNERNQVMASVPGLAHAANIPLEECREAIKKFESPDPDSRDPDNDGRRIEKINGGWLLLNAEKYKALQSPEERRAYKREWMRQKREEQKKAQEEAFPEPPPLPEEPENPPSNAKQAESVRKELATINPATRIPPTEQQIRERMAECGYFHTSAERFFNHYESNGWKVGKNKMKNWHTALANWEVRDREEKKEKGGKKSDMAIAADAINASRAARGYNQNER